MMHDHYGTTFAVAGDLLGAERRLTGLVELPTPSPVEPDTSAAAAAAAAAAGGAAASAAAAGSAAAAAAAAAGLI